VVKRKYFFRKRQKPRFARHAFLEACLVTRRDIKLIVTENVPGAAWLQRVTLCIVLLYILTGNVYAQSIRIGVFNVDATPPIGSPVAYATTRSITDSLSARGIVITGIGKPIVLCAVDWIGIANEGLDVWKQHLAKAANTTVDRVSIHSLHQHDASRCDFTVEAILTKYGLGGTRFDNAFYLRVLDNLALEVKHAAENTQPVTHIGFGEAKVEKVASNRRVLGKDGQVAIVRFSSSRDPKAVAAPEGLIDPWLKCISFWNKDTALAVLTYYATHPQSYYGTGDVSCDFVGIARNSFEKLTGVPVIHFNGAGGNIAAGKYNDGSAAMRPVLADRLETGMKKAWAATKKIAVTGNIVAWKNTFIKLPVASYLNEDTLIAKLSSNRLTPNQKYTAAIEMAWFKQSQAGREVEVSALRLGRLWLLNIPGEAFVEYQLAAQSFRPGDFVCTAAYEEYGPRYIGTSIAYSQGGYEINPGVSFVGPGSEAILMKAIKEVLK
jgi:hypothetical protein